MHRLTWIKPFSMSLDLLYIQWSFWNFLPLGQWPSSLKILGHIARDMWPPSNPHRDRLWAFWDPRGSHSLEASFLWKIKLTSIRIIFFSYILVLYDIQISFSLKLVTVWHLWQEGLTFIPFIVIFTSYESEVFFFLSLLDTDFSSQLLCFAYI